MPPWVMLAVLSALLAACVPILAKRGLTGIDATAATALRAFVAAAFFGVLVLLRGGLRIPDWGGPREAGWIAASGLAGALSWLCYFAALDRGRVSAVVALDRTSVIFAVVFAWLFLAEPLDVRSFAGAALIAAGAIMVAWR